MQSPEIVLLRSVTGNEWVNMKYSYAVLIKFYKIVKIQHYSLLSLQFFRGFTSLHLPFPLSHIVSHIDTEREHDLLLLCLTECDWIKHLLFKNLRHWQLGRKMKEYSKNEQQQLICTCSLQYFSSWVLNKCFFFIKFRNHKID